MPFSGPYVLVQPVLERSCNGVPGCLIQLSDFLEWAILTIDLKALSLKSFIGLVVSLF